MEVAGKVYAYDEIRHIHLEPTTKCNAACPMCARNACGQVASGLELAELTAADIRSIVPPDLLARIAGIDLCGAYGDPAVARELVEIVRYLRDGSSEATITVFTNGGVRSPSWWERLAEALAPHGSIVFAVDGLKDTNGIYRRGVDFERVMRNAAAFIDAGGVAQWDFIAFRHNERQVDEARATAAAMGFSQFSVKRTARFMKHAYDYVPELEGHDDRSRFPIYSAERQVVGYLEPPGDVSLRNPTAQQYEGFVAAPGGLDGVFSSTPIRCRVLDTHSVFVGAQGYAFPCCWTYVQATTPLLHDFSPGVDHQVYDLVEAHGGLERLSARDGRLRAVVEGPLFAAVERSWSCGGIDEGRLRVCARVCGVEFPAYDDQFESPELVPGTA